MGDFSPDNKQTRAQESKESIFDSSKFWGVGPRNRKSLSKVIEISPIKIEEQEGINQQEVIVEQEEIVQQEVKDESPKKQSNISSPNNVQLYDTISGNTIISRGWDGNNMGVFKVRRKN